MTVRFSYSPSTSCCISLTHCPHPSFEASEYRESNGPSRALFSTALLRSMAYGMPSIDLFASRINRKVPRYVSWRPDPGAQFVDAFSFSWSQEQFYAFPPFSLILRCLKKIEMEEGEGIIIVPVWPTQPWYPKLMSLLIDTPRLLPVTRGTLYLPSKPSQPHPMEGKLKLIACKLSGNLLRSKAFLQKLPRLSSSRGGKHI